MNTEAMPDRFEYVKQERGQSALSVAGAILVARLAVLVDKPELIESVERLPGGGWVVAHHLPGRDDWPLLYSEISADGVLVRTWQDDPNDPREREYEVWPDSPPGFPLSTGHGRREVKHVEFFEEGNPSLFEAENISQIAYDNRVIVQKQARAASAGFRRGEGGEWEPPADRDVEPYAGEGLGRLRWPLIVGGGVLILLAAFEIIRRRR